MQHYPIFSIIIPTYERPEKLHACLRAVAALDYPRDRFEVVVVDDGGQEPLKEWIAPFREEIVLKVVRQENAGPAAARNNGARRATAEFLAFTDDDCAPDPGWLRAFACQFARTPDHLLGGRTINALRENHFSTASQQLVSYLYAYYNRDPETARFFASNNFALRTEIFHRLGGFATTFPLAAGEDRDFCDRWVHNGYRMTWVPEAVVRHFHDLTLVRFWRQHFNYGRGAFPFHKARARRGQEPMKREPLSFYLDLLRYPLSEGSGRSAFVHAGLLFLAQGANAAGFFWERRRQRRVNRTA